MNWNYKHPRQNKGMIVLGLIIAAVGFIIKFIVEFFN